MDGISVHYGYKVTAFITLEIRQADGHDPVANRLSTIPEVLEVHSITGAGDMLCRVVARSNADPQRVLEASVAKVGAAGVAGSWLLVIVASVALRRGTTGMTWPNGAVVPPLVRIDHVLTAELMPAHLVVAALALGNTIGQTAVAIPMVIATRRIRGPAAVPGIGHATTSGLAAGAAGAAVGATVCLASPKGGKLVVTGVAVLAASGAVIAFGVVAFILDRGDLRTVVARLRWAGPAAGPADQVAASGPWSGRPPRRAVTACRMEQDPRHRRSRVHRLCTGPAPLRALPSADDLVGHQPRHQPGCLPGLRSQCHMAGAAMTERTLPA